MSGWIVCYLINLFDDIRDFFRLEKERKRQEELLEETLVQSERKLQSLRQRNLDTQTQRDFRRDQ